MADFIPAAYGSISLDRSGLPPQALRRRFLCFNHQLVEPWKLTFI